MEVLKSKIDGLLVFKPNIFEDKRGYFMESYTESFFNKNYPNINFVQENESYSKKGVLRGLHFQIPPKSQSKLVRVIYGEVLDVAVDLRLNSKTFGQHESIILSGENKKQFFIPKGFAHGFIVLSKFAIVSYKVDNYYSPLHESGIIYNDNNLNIDWKFESDKLIVSEKDLKLDTLVNYTKKI